MLFKKKSKHEKLQECLTELRKNIPKEYNQAELLNYLDNDNIDLYFSITTRGDGKTFNYLYALAYLSLKLNFTTIIIVRHMEIRNAMLAQIEDMYRTIKAFNVNRFTYKVNMDYVSVEYAEKTPFIVCDLNNANDLKNYSAVLKKANLILYDEFLAVGADYAPHEFAKFKTIFETMDRGKTDAMDYTNGRRKAIFLANPVDFSSEFLAQWNLYHYLETQPMNTIKTYHNIAIERRKNTPAQTHKNNRIFNDDINESLTGQFHVNDWSIREPKTNSRYVTIKTQDKYINIYFENKPILSVVPYEEHYQYNTELVDNTDDSTYLKPSYYQDNFYKKYTSDRFLFANQYSKSYILGSYPTLNIGRVVRQNLTYKPTIETQEKELKHTQTEIIKRRLLDQYLR